MLQRQIIVPARRKQQNSQNLVDDFYGEDCFDSYEFEEITSLLAKRLKFENNDESISEGKKIKRCCMKDGEFISYIPEIEIMAPSPQILEMQAEIRSHPIHISHQKNKEKKQQITQSNVEFKSISIGEVNYIEHLEKSNFQVEIKNSSKKQAKQDITKKIHKH